MGLGNMWGQGTPSVQNNFYVYHLNLDITWNRRGDTVKYLISVIRQLLVIGWLSLQKLAVISVILGLTVELES